jgi:hypothetical protein
MSCGQGQLRVREAPMTVSRRKPPARGWQGDSVYTEQPGARSTPVSPRRMECWGRLITSFAPLRANNKTLTHGLDTGSSPPQHSQPGPGAGALCWERVWGGGPWGAHQAQAQASLGPGFHPRLWSCFWAHHFFLGLSSLIRGIRCNSQAGKMRFK